MSGELDEIGYQLKELNKNIKELNDTLSDLSDLAGINNSLDKLLDIQKDIIKGEGSG